MMQYNQIDFLKLLKWSDVMIISSAVMFSVLFTLVYTSLSIKTDSTYLVNIWTGGLQKIKTC